MCDCIRQENKATGSYCLFSDSTALPAREEVRSEDDILLVVRVNLQFIKFCSFAYFLFNFQLFATSISDVTLLQEEDSDREQQQDSDKPKQKGYFIVQCYFLHTLRMVRRNP